MSDLYRLPKRWQAKILQDFQDTAIRAMEEYPDGPPEYICRINPPLAAIIAGDFDEYERLLDQLSDYDLNQEAVAPGTSREPSPESFYYQ